MSKTLEISSRDGQDNLDIDYKEWLSEVSNRYQRSQIQAATTVNREMLIFYWSLGRDITLLKAESRWGSKFLKRLSSDLRQRFPNTKGFSVTNLRYMTYFYKLYPFKEIYPQLEDKLSAFNVDSETLTIHPQLGDELQIPPKIHSDAIQAIFSVPWGHHKAIIDKCGSDVDKAIFYARQTVTNNWSRAVLLNWLDTDLYDRQGKAITNFHTTLPAPQSDLAQEMTRDPYNFDFIAIRQRYDEKELKDALMDNVQRLLMEFGSGFAFVDREYRLIVGNTEQFLDLLLYNIKLHCYVVVEVKVSDFDPRDMGQLSTYVAAVDGILKGELDAPTVGLLICKTKDNILAQYAVNVINAPIGISEYQLSNLLKEEFHGSLPTIEEIENQLRDAEP